MELQVESGYLENLDKSFTRIDRSDKLDCSQQLFSLLYPGQLEYSAFSEVKNHL